MKNSGTLPDGIVHFRNLDTQAPQVGPSFLGVENKRPAIAQPHQGIGHNASSRNSQTFTPVPIVPILICKLLEIQTQQNTTEAQFLDTKKLLRPTPEYGNQADV